MTAATPLSIALPTAEKLERRPWLPLSLLTLFAAILRFSNLSHPDLWYDEAATFHRVTSTYADMLAVLRTDGFVPLHYNLYWILAQHLTLTPAVMRFVPALAGTLMVPAIYFLAAELVSRRAALLAAAFAACSAWLMVFSHDAKMYMHFWLFLTLHVASLLWWMRTGRRIPFWCTVAAGCAMAGLHATGLLLLPLDLLLFLAHPRTTYRRALPFTLALALILAGPVGYYAKFNRFTDTIQTNWNLSGIQWVEWRNQNHSTPAILADTASAFFQAFNFIAEPPIFSDPPGPSPHRIVLAARITLATTAAFLLLALLPWPGTYRSDPRPLPSPLTLFYLTTWILLPCYVMYCASTLGFASPLAFLPWYLWAIAAALLPILLIFLPRTRPHAARTLLPVAVPILLCLAVYLSIRHRVPAGSIWMPRYLGIIFPALLITTATLITRLPKPLRYTAITLILVVNLTQSLARLTLPTEPPIARVAQDVWDARDPAGPSRTYVQVRPGFGPPGSGTVTNNVGLYYLRLLSHQLIRPAEFRFASSDRITPTHRFTDTFLVADDLQQSPAVHKLILWTETDDQTPETESRLLAQLGPAWSRQSAEEIPVRVYWTWAPVYTYRRTTFVKS